MAEQNMEATELSKGNSAALTGLGGVYGIKAGMTQVLDKNGDLVPVTVIDVQPNVITQVKQQNTDGYVAVQVGMLPKKAHRVTKAEKGHFKKSGSAGFYHVGEFRVPSAESLAVGMTLSTEFIKEGDFIDVTGESKGKGFQGGMKRYNMSGGFKTHGASLSHRSLGSIGNRADPAKCFKNKKMPGQMGNEQVTVQNLKVVSVDSENNLILVLGSIPGAKNKIVRIKKAVKKLG